MKKLQKKPAIKKDSTAAKITRNKSVKHSDTPVINTSYMSHWSWIIITIIIQFVAIIRIRFLQNPLVRDEDEFVYMGEDILII